MGLLLARICLAAIFAYTGGDEIRSLDETAGALAGMGYPVPKVMAIVAAIAQIGGAVSLLLGMLTPLGCIALILFLLPTTYSFHLPHALHGDGGEIIHTLKNLGLVGGLIAMLFSGPGRISVDARFMKGQQ